MKEPPFHSVRLETLDGRGGGEEGRERRGGRQSIKDT